MHKVVLLQTGSVTLEPFELPVNHEDTVDFEFPHILDQNPENTLVSFWHNFKMQYFNFKFSHGETNNNFFEFLQMESVIVPVSNSQGVMDGNIRFIDTFIEKT